MAKPNICVRRFLARVARRPSERSPLSNLDPKRARDIIATLTRYQAPCSLCGALPDEECAVENFSPKG